jgi:hypothetical protein
MFDEFTDIKSEIPGVFQADLILRSAIIEAINDLRANPWLLRYCFNGLILDPLTKDEYGKNEVDRAVEWFITHDIPVFLDTRKDPVKLPAISIKLVSSTEDAATLADVHYDPTEDSSISEFKLTQNFNAISYDQNTGKVTIPKDIGDSFILAAGQVLVDKAGNQFGILEVLDFNVFRISKNLITDLSNSYIKGKDPAYIATLESMYFKETCQLGLHVAGEQVHLVYLHSIMQFILLRYKQSLLEARNLERTQISSSDFGLNPAFEKELVYSRYITVTGYTKNVWPKFVTPKATAIYTGVVTGLNKGIRVIDGGDMFSPSEELNQLWVGDGDGEGGAPDINLAQNNAITAGAGAPLIYFGVSPNGTLNESFIKSLTYSIPGLGKQGNVSFNAGANQYCWYAFPASYGGIDTDFTDSSTGFPFGIALVATINVTDSFGTTRPYSLWRSDYPNLGFVSMQII